MLNTVDNPKANGSANTPTGFMATARQWRRFRNSGSIPRGLGLSFWVSLKVAVWIPPWRKIVSGKLE